MLEKVCGSRSARAASSRHGAVLARLGAGLVVRGGGRPALRGGLRVVAQRGRAHEEGGVPRLVAHHAAPKIARGQDGFFRGFDASCVAVCATFINKDFDELGAMPRKDQGEACADYRQQLPKPTTMRACGTGYNAGYEWGLKEADAIVETANAAGMSSEPMAEVAEVAEEELEEEPEEEPVES